MDLKKQFIQYETERAKEGLKVALQRIRRDADYALHQLAGGDPLVVLTGFANNLADAHRRFGSLEQLLNFAKLDEPDTVAPAPTQPLNEEEGPPDSKRGSRRGAKR